MSKVLVVLFAFLVFSSATFASQPGQAIDITDWVVVAPEINMRVFQPPPCETDFCHGQWVYTEVWPHDLSGVASDRPGNPRVIDNQGNVLMRRRKKVIFSGSLYSLFGYRTELVRFSGGVEEVLAFVDDRRSPSGNADRIRPARSAFQTEDSSGWCGNNPEEGYLLFDPLTGRLLAPLVSHAHGCTWGGEYGGGFWVAAFEGFTTLFDVIDSYVPTTGSIGFRVPQRPEALRAADHFDTYWGQVTRPLDLSQAHPLQCAYPDHRPQVGEYLTYPDSAPAPSPGQAVYYLTSVSYQGQTRAGRRALDGRLSGRDATRLPACVVEKETKR